MAGGADDVEDDVRKASDVVVRRRCAYMGRDPGVGHPPVEVGNQVSGPVGHGGFGPFDAEHAVVDAGGRARAGSRRGVQPAQTFVQRELALGDFQRQFREALEAARS